MSRLLIHLLTYSTYHHCPNSFAIKQRRKRVDHSPKSFSVPWNNFSLRISSERLAMFPTPPPSPTTISEIFGLTRLSDYCNSFIKMDKNYLMKELLPRSPLITQLIGQVICCFLYKPIKHFCYLMPGVKNIKESWENSALNREIYFKLRRRARNYSYRSNSQIIIFLV